MREGIIGAMIKEPPNIFFLGASLKIYAVSTGYPFILCVREIGLFNLWWWFWEVHALRFSSWAQLFEVVWFQGFWKGHFPKVLVPGIMIGNLVTFLCGHIAIWTQRMHHLFIGAFPWEMSETETDPLIMDLYCAGKSVHWYLHIA